MPDLLRHIPHLHNLAGGQIRVVETKRSNDACPTGAETIPGGPHAPNLNAYAERWVLSIKSECLDHFTFLGEKHLLHVIREYFAYYHEQRPHQGVDNVPLMGEIADAADILSIEDVICEERLGGLLKRYRHAA